jgi:hypothetical protein
MAELGSTTKAEFLAEVADAWDGFNAVIDRLSEGQLTGAQDEQGWTVKDHLVHLAAWERSTTFFLQGKPRHEGLGVEEALYMGDDVDAVNAQIYQQQKSLPLSQVMAMLQDTHQQLLAAIEPLTDDDLHKPYHHFQPGQPDDERIAMQVIHDNTIDHYDEHLGWIETLLGSKL